MQACILIITKELSAAKRTDIVYTAPGHRVQVWTGNYCHPVCQGEFFLLACQGVLTAALVKFLGYITRITG